MAKFIILIKGDGSGWNSLTPEQMQATMQKYFDWSAQLRTEGRYLDGNELGDAGPVLSRANGVTSIDGPFAETKESVGGYYLIEAADLNEAAEVSKGCPALEHGNTVEVRPVIEH